MNIKLKNINIVFKNTVNCNIYPFVWLTAKLSNNKLMDIIMSGSSVYLNDILIGIIYNINDSIIYIIPNINIKLILTNKKLSNIFFESELTDDKQELVITNRYNNKLIKNDKIYSINDIKLDKELVYESQIGIKIPVNTYIYYQSINNNIFNLTIIRDDKLFSFNIRSENLLSRLSFKTNPITKYHIIDKFIFAQPNLLFIEWINYNKIIFKNYLYLIYGVSPFIKRKDSYLFIGSTINIKELKPYQDESYNVNCSGYLQIFNIHSINNKKSYNINQLKYINKLVLIDSDEQEVILSI